MIRIVMPGNARIDFYRQPDGKFTQGGYSSFDGAEITKVGGSNPTGGTPLAGANVPPTPPGFSVAPPCGPNGTYFLRFRDGRQWRFDAAPNATKVTLQGGACLYFLGEMRDPQGRFITINRSEGRIQSISSSSGQSVTFSYDSNKNVVNGISDNVGRSVTYTHVQVDAQGGFRALGATSAGVAGQTEAGAIALGLIPIPPYRMASATTPEGTYNYTYEDDPPSIRIGGLSFNDPGTTISTSSPDCQNVRGGARLKTIQLPGIPGVFTNFYGPSKRVLRQTWPDGTELFFKYKIVGGCVPGLPSFGSQPSQGAPITGGATTTTCQGAGCIRTDSWNGDAVTGGNVVGFEVTDARGKAFSRSLHTSGLPSTETDETGQTVTIVRDFFNPNRVFSRTDSLGRTTSYTYDARGNRTKIVDPAGRETNIAYDPTWNKPTSVTRLLADSTPIVYRYAYNPATGVLTSSTDPEGNVTTYGYNAQNRLSSIRDPLGHETAIAYDNAGNPSAISDPLGNTVSMITDTAGRVTQTTDALGHTTNASYNALNQLTSITDAKEGLTQFNFDSRNNLQNVVNPLTTPIESYGYDTVGRLQTKTDAKTKSETYGYDGNGNLTSIVDRRNQTTTIAYNERNQPERVTFNNGSIQVRGYDAVGRLIEITEGDNGQRMEYDNLDRVTKVVTDTAVGQSTISYEYDNLDRRTKRIVSYPGGIAETTVYAYDKASRVNTITQTGTNGTQVVSYAWDAASRLTQKTLPNGIRQQLAYDDASRLLSITYLKTDDSVIESVAYTYDANGQRLSRSTSTTTPRDTLFAATYDNANRMSTITLTATGKTYMLTYDDHGNLAAKTNAADGSEQTTYTWDARNRLTSIAMGEGGQTSIATFKYDALGRRTERVVDQGATVQRTQFVYDGIQAIGELVDGRLSATVLTGLNIDEVIARTVNLAGGSPIDTKTYLTDALGSVLAMTNPAQNPELFYAYSAYGETSQLGADVNLPANSNQYTARENDGAVGGTNGGSLYYYRARYYDPVLKRFIAEDPVAILAGPNFYSYTNGKPTRFVDPLGLWTWGDPLPQSAVDAAAGFGDTLTSGFGIFDTSLTKLVRQKLDVDDQACASSDAYRYGRYGAYVWAAITGRAIASRMVAQRAAQIALERQIQRNLTEKLAETEALGDMWIRGQARMDAIAEALLQKGYTPEQVVKMMKGLIGGF